MRLKPLLLICVCLLVFLSSEAQHISGKMLSGGTGANLSDHVLMLNSKRALYGEPEEEIEGTPYLTETYDSANVFTSKGTYFGVPMRYNIHADYIEFKQADVLYILDPRPDINLVDFGSYKLVVHKKEIDGKTLLGFYALLDSGKVTLMSKKMVSFREKRPPKGLEYNGSPAKYSRLADEFVFKIGNGELLKVTSVKKMIDNFPDKQKELTDFANREKISKNEKELTKLVRYYNSL